jgi:hypothetical protein
MQWAKIKKENTKFFKPSQIQWQCPGIYGEENFVIMFGGLHTEMVGNKAIWLFLNTTSWVTTMTEAEVAFLGSAEYFTPIGPLHPHVCRKRRLNGAVLRMRPEKLKSRVTEGVAR